MFESSFDLPFIIGGFTGSLQPVDEAIGIPADVHFLSFFPPQKTRSPRGYVMLPSEETQFSMFLF